jgi:hypothetical protein
MASSCSNSESLSETTGPFIQLHEVFWVSAVLIRGISDIPWIIVTNSQFISSCSFRKKDSRIETEMFRECLNSNEYKGI